MVYNACKGDDFEGTITVHAVCEEWQTPAYWCEILAEDFGVDVKYEGEGLPSLARIVMLALLRRKVQRKGTTLEERAQLHKWQRGK